MQKKRTVIKYLLICLPIFLACNIPQASAAYTYDDFIANLKKYKVIEEDCDGTKEKCKKCEKYPALCNKDYFNSYEPLLECLTKTIPEQDIDFFDTCNKDDIANNARNMVIELFSKIEEHCIGINAKDLVGSYEDDAENKVTYKDPIDQTAPGLPIIFNDSTCDNPYYAIIRYRTLQTMLPITYGILLANTGTNAIPRTYLDATRNLKQGYLSKEYLTQMNWEFNCVYYPSTYVSPLALAANEIFGSGTAFIIDPPNNLHIFPGLLLADHRGNNESIPGILQYDGKGGVVPEFDRYKATKDSANALAQKLKNSDGCNDLSVYVIALPSIEFKERSLDKNVLGGVILYGPAE